MRPPPPLELLPTALAASAAASELLSTALAASAAASELLPTALAASAAASELLPTALAASAAASQLLSTALAASAAASELLSTALAASAAASELLPTALAASAANAFFIAPAFSPPGLGVGDRVLPHFSIPSGPSSSFPGQVLRPSFIELRAWGDVCYSRPRLPNSPDRLRTKSCPISLSPLARPLPSRARFSPVLHRTAGLG